MSRNKHPHLVQPIRSCAVDQQRAQNRQPRYRLTYNPTERLLDKRKTGLICVDSISVYVEHNIRVGKVGK